MIQFISEFKLPKEFSKKKKFDLMIGQFIEADSWKTIENGINWKINMDNQKVFLTVDACVKNALEEALNAGVSEKTLKEGYVALSGFTYPTYELNEIPLLRDPHNTAMDCEWNPDETSFNFTFRDTKWEEINLSTLKVDTFEFTKTDDGLFKIISFNVYAVVDMTKF